MQGIAGMREESTAQVVARWWKSTWLWLQLLIACVANLDAKVQVSAQNVLK